MKTLIIALLCAFTSLTSFGKGAEQLVSNTHGKSTVLQSHIKSLGTIGKNDRYEVNQVKIRGLDTPNLAAVLIYDRQDDSIIVVGPASAPGLGVAIVNGGATVGGSFLFGSKIRPTSQNISNDSASTSVNNVHATSNSNAASSSKSHSNSGSSATVVGSGNSSNANNNSATGGSPGNSGGSSCNENGHGHDN